MKMCFCSLIVAGVEVRALLTGVVRPEGAEGEWRYTSTLLLTSDLDGGGWIAPRPDRFIPGKETQYPFYKRLGKPQDRFRRVRKISPPPGFDPLTVKPVASRCTY
jgi:hypothetical protein